MKPKYSLVRVRASRRRFIPSILAAALAFALAAKPAHAASSAWLSDAAGNWNATGSWNATNGIPGSTTADNTDVATFGVTLTAGRAVTVDTTRFIGGITFSNTSAFGFTLQTGTLRLNSGGVIQSSGTVGAHTDTISSPIVISGTSAATASFTSGATTVANGVISVSGGVTGSATTGNTTTLTLNGTGTGANTVSGIIGNGSGGGTLAVAKSGTGTWALSGANTYSGGTTLSGGTLAISNATSLGAGGVTVSGGSQINATGVLTYANNIAVNAALTLRNVTATATTATFSGILSGSSAITLAINGTNNNNAILAFTNAANTFTGNVILPTTGSGNDFFSFNSLGDAGNFTIQKNGNREGIIYAGSSDLTFATRQIVIGTTFTGSFDGNGNPGNTIESTGTGTLSFNSNMGVTTVAGAGTIWFGGSNTGNNTFAGTITNPTSGGNLGVGKLGAGKWLLSNAANSYAGNVIVGAGTLSVASISNSANNQPLGKGKIQLGYGANSGALEFTGSSNSTTDKQVILGNTTAANTGAGSILSNGTGTLSFSAATFNQAITGITATRTLTLAGANTDANTISGIIQNNATGGLVAVTKANAGTWILSGVNTYSGNTTISGGTLVATNAASIGAGALAMSGGTLSLTNDTATTFGRNTTVSGAAAITSDRATVGAGVAHTLGTLSIGANTLTINRGANATSGTGGVTFGATTLTGAATFSTSADTLLTVAAVTQGANVLTKSGSGSMTATGVVAGSVAAGSSAISVTDGLLTFSGANTFTGNIAVSGSGVFAMPGATYTTTAPYGTLTGGTAYKQMLLTNGGTFRLTSGSFNNNTPTATNIAGGIIFNIGSGGGVFDVASGATLIVDDGTGTGTATSASQLQGAGNLTKTGLGTFSYDDSTAYAGSITVTAGSIQPASANAFGAATAGTIIQSGAQMNVNGITMTNAEPLTIVGTGLASDPQGSLVNRSGTAATWAGPVTMTGDATIGCSTSTGGLTLSSTATVNTSGNVLTFRITGTTGRIFTDGVISGTGSVVLNNSAAAADYVPRADHTYSGGTTFSSGLVAIDRSTVGNPGAIVSGPFGTGTVILSGGQLRAGTAQNRTVGNDITMSADTTFFTVTSEKTLNFTGPVTLVGGNRTITTNVGSTVAGAATIFSGAIGDGGNNLALSKTGTGNLVLNGANTYTGGTSADNGVLVLGGSVPTNTTLTIIPSTAAGVTFSLLRGSANPMTNVSALSYGSSAGSTNLTFELGADAGTSDSITTPSAATTAGNVNIAIAALPGFGSSTSYNLISAAGGLSGSSYVLTNVPGGYVYSLNATDSVVQLGVTPASSGDIYWRGNTNSSWSALSGSNTNWFTDAAGTTNAQASPGAGNTVRFSTINAASSGGVITTTLDNNYTVRNLIFGSDPNGVNSVTIAGGYSPALTQGILTVAPTSSADGIAVGSNAGNITISAPVILGGNQTWSVDGTGANGSSLTVSGAITGSSTLGVSGLVTISSANGTSTYTGATTVLDGGILQGGTGNSLSANSAVTVNSTGILRVNGSNNAIGSLAGSGFVENNNAATGATLTVGADGTNTTFSGTLRNGSAANLGFTKTGAGRLTLSGANTHTGTTTVDGGTLAIGSAAALTSVNNVALSSTGVLDLNGFSPTIGSFTGAVTNTVTNTSSSTAASTATTVGTPSGTGVYVDALTISTAAPTLNSLITDGPTRETQLIVNNANATNFLNIPNGTLNTFSGGLVLANNATGTRLNINATITGTPLGTGPIIMGQTSSDRAGIFFNTGDNTISQPLVINTALGTDRFGIRNDGRTITLSGLLTANADAVFSSNSATASNTRITNKVTGAGGLVLDLSQTTSGSTLHTVTLATSSGTNDYSGDTIVGRANATPSQNYTATLALGANEQIPHGAGKGNLIVNNNTGTRIGFFSMAAFSETINGLSGNGIVDGITGNPTLTLGDNNATATFSGVIQDTAGALTVTKVGTGTQTFSGANTFEGSLNVNAGRVAFATSPATAGPLGKTTVVNLNGGALSYTGTGANSLNRPIAIAAGAGTVEVVSSTGVLTIPSATSTGGNLVKSGGGTAVISGTTTLNSGAASVVINQGTLRAGFGTAGVATITVSGSGHLDQNNAATQSLVLANTTGALTLSGGSQLTFELNGANCDSIDTGTSGTAVTSGVVTLNFTGTPNVGVYNILTSTTGGLAGANYAIGTAPNGYNYTINKTDNLVTLTVSAQTPIYWRGGQNLSWNTLGTGSANWTTDGAGSTDASATPVSTDSVVFSATGAPLDGNNAIVTSLDAAFTVDSLQFTNTPVGITAVTIGAGSGGALTLTPASPSSGIRVLSGSGIVTISAPLTTGAAQTWDVAPSGSLIINGNTTFNGSVNKTNTGSLTLSGNNTGTGSITLSAGTLNLESNSALGSGTLNISAGTTINASLSAIALSGNNAQNWNGDFIFGGSNDLSMGTGAVTLGDNLTITTQGSIFSVAGAIGDGGNNRGFTKAGSGTMVLAGASNYGGVTAITAGSLRITNGAALGSTAAGTTQSGASALELDGSLGALTIGAEALSLNGTGVSTTGALRNIAGNNNYGGTITLAAQSRINSDLDTLTLSNTSAVIGSGQTLQVGGAGNTTISGNISLGAGGLIKDGLGTLVLSGINTYTGTTVISSGVVNLTGSTTGTGNVTVGNSASSVAVLNLPSGGSLVGTASGQSPTITLGTGGFGSVGVLNMTGGTLTLQGTDNSTDGISFGASNDGFGGFFMNGGIFTQQRFMFGGIGTTTGTGGIGVGLQTGGTVNSTGWMILARHGASTGVYTITGGTVNRTGAANDLALGLNGSGRAELNVAGGMIDNTGRRVDFSGGTGGTFSWTGTGVMNLNSGTLLTNAIFYSSGTAYANFNGGTLRAAATNTAFMNAITTGGAYVNGAFGSFSGGAVIDTNGFNATMAAALLAPSGDGVSSIPLSNGGSGYASAPHVQITGGGGFGATAYATINQATGAVTGIVVTNPGNNYTEAPTVTLIGGGGFGATADVVSLAPNVSGGLTKNGTGILTLTGANSYTGTTAVNAGTLLLNGSAATFPSTNAMNVNAGGTLAFTSTAASNLDLTGRSLTLNGGSITFDVGVSGTNDSIAVDNFTLSANSSFTFNSIGPVGGSYTLLTSVNPFVNTGSFTISGQSLGRVNLTPTIGTNTITVNTTVDEGIWNQTGGGNWSVGNSGGPSAPNWDNYKPTVAGDAALFGSAITAPSTVAVDTPHTVAYLRFNNANAYTIGTNGSSNLTLNNGTIAAQITVNSGSHTIAENTALLSNVGIFPATDTTLTISGIVSGTSRSVEVNGAGNVVLSGVNTYTGATTVSNGTLTLSGARTAAATGGFTVGTVAGNTATLNLSGGTFTVGTTGSNFLIGNVTGGTGIMNQSGGSITTAGNQLLVGNGGGTGIYNLSGGTLTTVAGALGVVVGVNTGSTATFNLSGTGVLSMPATSTLQIARSDNNLATNTTGTFNQTGGTATVGILQMSGSSATNNAGGNATLTLTGGTFAATTFSALSGGNNTTSTINIGGSAQVTLPAIPTTRGSGAVTTLTLDSTSGFLAPAAASTAYMTAGTFTNAYLTANGAKFNVLSGRDVTIAQVFQNATDQVGTLTKDGLGALTLSGANTYTGLTSVLAGGITVGDVNALGTLDAGTTVASGGRVAFNPLATGATVAENFNVAGNGSASNGVLNVGGNKTINLSGDIVLSADSRFTVDGGSAFNFIGANGISGDNTNLSINTDGSVASSITGPLAIGTGNLTKSGGSTLILSGNSNYSGGTIIQGGVVSVTTSNNALGSGSVNIDGGLRLAVAAGLNVPNAVTVTSPTGAVGRGTIESSGASGIATISGPITILGNPSSGGMLLGATGTVLHLAGPITAAASFSQRDGRVMYSGGGTGYSAILITGTAIVGANDGIATSATVSLGGSAVASLDLNGYNQSLAGVQQAAAFAATIGNSSTTADSVLTTTGTSSFIGTIVDSISGGTRKVGLAVASGQLTLTGDSSFTGDITVSGGKLRASAGPVANNSLSGLGASSNTRTITVGSGATLEFGSGNVFGNHATVNVPTIVVNGGTVTNADLANSVAPNRKVNNALNNLTLNDGTLTATVGNEDSTDIRPGEGYGTWGLNGTVTSTGTSTIDTTAVTGKAGRVLLSSNTADTVFNVASGTLTVASVLQTGDSATVYGLTKSGSGTLVLSAVNIYTANTSVNAGTLQLTGSIAGTASVATTGVLAGTGSVAGATTVATTGVVSPGVNNVGTLSFGSSLTLESGSNYAVGITGNGVNDKVNVTGTLAAGGTITVSLENGYVPVAGATFDIADAASITGTPTFSLPTLAGLKWNTDSFSTTGQIVVETADPFATWASGFGLTGGDAAKSADPDGDGMNNLLEFATNSNPTNGGSGARVYPKIHVIGGSPVLTYTVATRAVATFAANGSKQEAIKDLVKYTIEGSDDLTTWNTVVVSEVEGDDAASVRSAIVPALLNLDSGWEWHTFRTEGDTATDSSDYMRLRVTDATPQ